MGMAGSAAFVLCSLFGATPAPMAALTEPSQAYPLTVESGRTTMTLSGEGGGRSYLAVVGSLVPRGKSSTLTVHSEVVRPGETRVAVAPAEDRPAWWTWRVENDRRQMQRVRDLPRGQSTYSTARFSATRTFHLFVGEDDLYDTKKYAAVEARLAKTGRWCLLYVDQRDKVAPELLEEIATTFDERVFPAARQRFGEHRDVDRNGKFTILITGWLDRLSAGKVALSGFVRGADFYRDVAAPYSNQCDMLYLNASLSPGEHLRTVLAHEYTHAITFCQHTFEEYLPGANGQDEEAWLGEAMAHLAENYHGDGWSNLDYRISTYLSDPGAYRLVVPDYFQDGLWRSHGCRGATYLFLRYLVDRFGPELLTELSRSNLEGIANIETATQTPFAELFRDWSVHLAASGAVGHPFGPTTLSVPIFGRLGERLLAGPRPLVVQEGTVETTLAPTSWASLIIRVPAGQSRSIVILGEESAQLQVTLIPLPADHAQVDLQVACVEGNVDEVRLDWVGDPHIRWQSLSWERARLRQERPRGNEKLARIISANKVLSADQAKAGSGTIDLSEFDGDPVVFKLIGIDSEGRYVSAWATYASPNEPERITQTVRSNEAGLNAD